MKYMFLNKVHDENSLLKIALVLTFIGMLINLGVQPLYLEEPRRALVAMEMLQNNQYFAPTLLGEWYYNKPPVYNWLLILSAYFFGDFTEFALRLPTVLSLFIISIMMVKLGKTYNNKLIALAAPLFFICGSSILFYFSFLAEIDLFYTLITFAGICAIYYLGSKQKFLLLFMTAYLGCALGFLTKGLPSLPFTAVSLLVYFIDSKNWKKLLSPEHLAGITLFTFIIGGYLWIYSGYNDPINLIQKFFSESGDRTAVANTFSSLLRHLVIFPFDLIKDFLPAGLAVIFLIRKDIRHLLLERNEWIRYCTLIFFANLIIYWISPGTRMRYVYPIYPFLAIIIAWVYSLKNELSNVWQERIFQSLTGVLLAILTVGSTAISFISDLNFLPYKIPLSLMSVVIFGTILLLWLKYKHLSLPAIFLALAIGRIIFDLTVFPQRNLDSEAQRNRDLAGQIQSMSNNAPLHLFGESKLISYTTSYYLNRHRKSAVVLADSLIRDHFYLLPTHYYKTADSILLTTTYQRDTVFLIQHHR